MKHIPTDLVERLKPVSLFLMDVDGTLTDGRLYYNAEWVESKAFDVSDGFGIHAIHQYGIKTGIITGRQSLIVSERAKELGIEIVHQGRFEKDKILDKILQSEGLEDRQIAFIGDDLFDLPVLLRVGFSAAPADAHPEVRDRVHFVSDFNGGWGAVRQVCELILKVQGHWDSLMKRYLRQA